MIDYSTFVPVVSKAIELMFDPKTIRMRAELIEKTDLSAEALLNGLTVQGFEDKLRHLFRSYDVDGSGSIEFDEFIAVMEALELQLSYNEMVSLFDAADVKHSRTLQFEEFVEFFSQHLLNLEREKHLRLLQSSIHDMSVSIDATDDSEQALKNEAFQTFSHEMTFLFKMYDHNNTGLIKYSDFQTVLSFVSSSFSSYLMDVLKSEVHTDENGMVDYASTIHTCAELAKVMVAKEKADDEHASKMAWAEERAVMILSEQIDEIDHISSYLMLKLKMVSDDKEIASDAARFIEVEKVLNDTHSGLSHSESHLLVSKLFHISEKELTNIESIVGHEIKHDGLDNSRIKLHKLSTAENMMIQQPLETSPNSKQTRSDADHVEFRLNFAALGDSIIISRFTKEDLSTHVFEVRKLSIVRRLLKKVESSSIKKRLLSLLNEEKTALVATGVMDKESNNLPISTYFKVLNETRDLMLSSANIIFIISSIESEDTSTISIDSFVDHASAIISKLQSSASQTARAKVVSKTKISDKKALNGWKKRDLENYLTDAFRSASNEAGDIVSEIKFWQIIKNIPRLKLTDIEATTIANSFNNHMKWKDAAHPTVYISIKILLIPIIYLFQVNAIRALCREKFINRRMQLAASIEDVDSNAKKDFSVDSMASLVSIAKRLLTVVKVTVQGDNVVLIFPTDGSNNVVASAYRKDHGVEEAELHEDGREAHTLFRGEKAIPFLTKKKVIKSKGKASEEEWTVEKKTVDARLKVVAVEDIVMFSGVILIAEVVYDEGDVISNSLNVRLPSVVLMDRDSAELFIENLVDSIYIESNGDNITIKVEGE